MKNSFDEDSSFLDKHSEYVMATLEYLADDIVIEYTGILLNSVVDIGKKYFMMKYLFIISVIFNMLLLCTLFWVL